MVGLRCARPTLQSAQHQILIGPVCPGGTFDSSPAVHCWENGRDDDPWSPVGTTDAGATPSFQSSLRDFGKSMRTRHPAMNRRAIVTCPSGAKTCVTTRVGRRAQGPLTLLGGLRVIAAKNFSRWRISRVLPRSAAFFSTARNSFGSKELRRRFCRRPRHGGRRGQQNAIAQLLSRQALAPQNERQMATNNNRRLQSAIMADGS